MNKILSAIFFAIMLVISVDTRAGDNLGMSSFTDSAKVPSSYLNLGGGSALVNQTYKDDDGKVRKDKSYYIISHSYNSTYKGSDVANILDPASGRLGSLFQETTVFKKTKQNDLFTAHMIIHALKEFECESMLKIKNYQDKNKNVFLYTVTEFNMVFTVGGI